MRLDQKVRIQADGKILVIPNSHSSHEMRVTFSDKEVIEMKARLKARLDGHPLGREKDVGHVAPMHVCLVSGETHRLCLGEMPHDEIAGSTARCRAHFRRVDLRESDTLKSQGIEAKVDEDLEGVSVLLEQCFLPQCSSCY